MILNDIYSETSFKMPNFVILSYSDFELNMIKYETKSKNIETS